MNIKGLKLSIDFFEEKINVEYKNDVLMFSSVDFQNYKVLLSNTEDKNSFIEEVNFYTEVKNFSENATVGILPFGSIMNEKITFFKVRQKSTRWTKVVDGVPERILDSAPDRSANIVVIRDNEKALVFAYIDDLHNHWISVRLEESPSLVFHFRLNKNICLKHGETREIGKFIIKFYKNTSVEEAVHDFGKLYFLYMGRKRYKTPKWLLNSPILEFHPSFIGGFKNRKNVNQLAKQLRDLRIKTIYLMPIWKYTNISGRLWNENWACSGSIYSIKDYYSLDPFLGNFEDLKYFIDTMHANDIRVLLDLVIQGCSRDSSLPRKHPEWFMRNKGGEMFGSHGWDDTYAFDSTHPEVIKYFLDIVRYYIKEFDVDGFRTDAPAWKEANFASDYPYEPGYTCFGGVRLLERIYNEVKNIKSDAVVISEDGGPIFYNKCDASYDIYAHWNAFIYERMSSYNWKKWIKNYFALFPEDMYRLNFNESHDTHYLSPWRKQWRGSLKSRLIMANLVFTGFIPMVWYPEIVDNFSFFEKIFAFREKFADFILNTKLDFGIESDDENILVLGRYSRRKQIIYIANFNSEYRKLVMKLPNIEGYIIPDMMYYFYDLWENRKFEIIRNKDYHISFKKWFYGCELFKNFELYVPPLQPVILEINEYKNV